MNLTNLITGATVTAALAMCTAAAAQAPSQATGAVAKKSPAASKVARQGNDRTQAGDAVAAALKMAPVKEADPLKDAKPGTVWACEGFTLANGMSAPIDRARLECSNGMTTYLTDMVAGGWAVASSVSTPDGDFGGTARFRHNLVFKKL